MHGIDQVKLMDSGTALFEAPDLDAATQKVSELLLRGGGSLRRDGEKLLLDFACDFGKRLLDRELDEVAIEGSYLDEEGREVDIVQCGLASYLADELMQACRRRFYKPEYIACPGCGRTMYNLEAAFERVKAATSHLSGMVIAVMGCIVNGPGEMADADWGYVGEGGGKVSIYKGKDLVLRHVPEEEAVDRLLELIGSETTARR